MKKFLLIGLTLLSFSAFASAQSYNDLSVEYLGYDADYDACGFAFSLNNPLYTPSSREDLEGGVTGLTLNLVFPEGWECEPDYVLVVEGEGRGYYKKGVKKYQYTAAAAIPAGKPSNYMNLTLVPSTSGVYPLEGTSGEVFRVYFPVSSIPDGYYPIYMRADGENYMTTSILRYDFGAMTLVAKVGNPSTSSLAVTGILPSDEATEMATATGLTSLDLTNCTSVNGALPLVDGCEVTFPAAGITTDVAYSRAAGSNKYASVVLPFATTTGTYYTFTGVDSEGIAQFSAGTGLAAGVPAITEVATLASVSETAVLCGATPEAKAAATKRVGNTKGQYYVSNNQLKSVNNTNFNTYRGIFDFGGDFEVRGFALNDVETGITTLLDSNMNEVESIFDLNGRKMQNTRRGVNIVNGKKFVVK